MASSDDGRSKISPSRQDILGLLDDIDNDGQGLTDFEIDFIDSMLKHPGEFSQEQIDLVRRIYKERVE